MLTTTQLDCPTCGATQDASLYESVNVTANPETKLKVLQREINQIRCSGCGNKITPPVNFLYHDRVRSYMVWLRADGARNGDEMTSRKVRLNLADTVLRIVHHYDALVEKIRIFDNRLDDTIIEYMKLALWPELSGRDRDYCTGNEIRLTGMTWPVLRFEMKYGGRLRHFTCPYEEYQKCIKPVAELRSGINRGSWCVVDHDLVANTFFPAHQAHPAQDISEAPEWHWDRDSTSGFWGRLRTAFKAGA